MQLRWGGRSKRATERREDVVPERGKERKRQGKEAEEPRSATAAGHWGAGPGLATMSLLHHTTLLRTAPRPRGPDFSPVSLVSLSSTETKEGKMIITHLSVQTVGSIVISPLWE